MCGILGIFDVPPNTSQSELRKKLIECVRRRRPAARPPPTIAGRIRSTGAAPAPPRAGLERLPAPEPRARGRGPEEVRERHAARHRREFVERVAHAARRARPPKRRRPIFAHPSCLRRLTISEGGARGKAQHAIAHERLAIMDPESGAQPLFAAAQRGPDGTVTVEEASVIVAANGEIYNYKELYAELAADGFAYAPKTGSDPCGNQSSTRLQCARMRQFRRAAFCCASRT